MRAASGVRRRADGVDAGPGSIAAASFTITLSLFFSFFCFCLFVESLRRTRPQHGRRQRCPHSQGPARHLGPSPIGRHRRRQRGRSLRRRRRRRHSFVFVVDLVVVVAFVPTAVFSSSAHLLGCRSRRLSKSIISPSIDTHHSGHIFFEFKAELMQSKSMTRNHPATRKNETRTRLC